MKLYKMMWGWSNNYAVKPQCIQGASGVCVCMCALLSYLGRLSFYLGLPANFPLEAKSQGCSSRREWGEPLPLLRVSVGRPARASAWPDAAQSAVVPSGSLEGLTWPGLPSGSLELFDLAWIRSSCILTGGPRPCRGERMA